MSEADAEKAEPTFPDEVNGWPPVVQPGSGARLPESDKDPAKYLDDDEEGDEP